MSDSARTTIIRVAGIAIFLLAVASAVLPSVPNVTARLAIGSLLTIAGAVEMAAVFARRGHHLPAGIAAGASLLAGVWLLLGGLPIAVLVYGLFGTTDEITATFSWVFAASFIAAGWLLIAAAPLEACETD
jgi:uncharacterized membrane protein HdeD (DUF308 family)